MSRSRILRSHSSDDILYPNLNYSSSLAYDNYLHPSSFDYSDPLDYGQGGYESRNHRDLLQSCRSNDVVTNHYQRQPVKERRVRWDLPEVDTTHDRLSRTIERSYRIHGANSYQNSNQSCLIPQQMTVGIMKAWQDMTLIIVHTTRGPRLQACMESVPRLGIFPRSTIRVCMTHRSPNFPDQTISHLHMVDGVMMPHRYPSLSSLKSPFTHMGYYSSGGTDYGAANSLLTSQLNLRTPKMRRSIIGLNRWSLFN
ncbi:hypothetical protein VP01_137g4 [Puccinia sorghi]|uniref:Uncharacterized protein n=1 Tax=Puccinia sorghi TaxID=27349 RepID=A0A0L6VM10_9BASI|nr:hypothetical protein VP01_137g4 [Puccinia sorghi]